MIYYLPLWVESPHPLDTEIKYESLGIVDCMLFTFENRVLLMR